MEGRENDEERQKRRGKGQRVKKRWEEGERKKIDSHSFKMGPYTILIKHVNL